MRLTSGHLSKLLLLPALLGFAAPAHADPVRVESRNVVLYGDVNPCTVSLRSPEGAVSLPASAKIMRR